MPSLRRPANAREESGKEIPFLGTSRFYDYFGAKYHACFICEEILDRVRRGEDLHEATITAVAARMVSRKSRRKHRLNLQDRFLLAMLMDLGLDVSSFIPETGLKDA